jgi:hypothetical protein
MIGPAEIEDMLADYTEARAKDGAEKRGEAQHWPVTQVQALSPGSTLAVFGGSAKCRSDLRGKLIGDHISGI